MTVIQIVECSDEIIAKIPNIMGLLFEIYGKSEMKLFAIQNDDKLGFLAKVDNNVTDFCIVTWQQEETIHQDNVTINVIPLYKFLLAEQR